MVRAVVGTLVEVGRGRMSLDEFRLVIEGKKRTQAGESMPAKALFLEEIKYSLQAKRPKVERKIKCAASRLRN
jgi:tRNA U38,U39,U40 pseudouridine synthase TruA